MTKQKKRTYIAYPSSGETMLATINRCRVTISNFRSLGQAKVANMHLRQYVQINCTVQVLFPSCRTNDLWIRWYYWIRNILYPHLCQRSHHYSLAQSQCVPLVSKLITCQGFYMTMGWEQVSQLPAIGIEYMQWTCNLIFEITLLKSLHFPHNLQWHFQPVILDLSMSLKSEAHALPQIR